jgi:hypothetical protein
MIIKVVAIAGLLFFALAITVGLYWGTVGSSGDWLKEKH